MSELWMGKFLMRALLFLLIALLVLYFFPLKAC